MANPFDPILTIKEVNNSFKQYRILEGLGGGGQGSVFRGIDLRSGEEVAVKIYSPNQLIKRAELEVSKLEKVDTPNLAKVVEHGNVRLRETNCYFVTTKYMEGSDLKDVLDIKKLTPGETRKLLIDILSAIDDLWKLRVVHSDLKPANILYMSTGDFVLIDLGFAKHLDNETITMGQVIYGTWGYIAPEQLKGRRHLTLRADMFSLGVLAYEAITGIHPYHRNQDLIFHGKLQVTPIKDLIDVDEKLSKAIHWLMEPNPLKRPISGKKVIELLREDL